MTSVLTTSRTVFAANRSLLLTRDQVRDAAFGLSRACPVCFVVGSGLVRNHDHGSKPLPRGCCLRSFRHKMNSKWLCYRCFGKHKKTNCPLEVVDKDGNKPLSRSRMAPHGHCYACLFPESMHNVDDLGQQQDGLSCALQPSNNFTDSFCWLLVRWSRDDLSRHAVDAGLVAPMTDEVLFNQWVNEVESGAAMTNGARLLVQFRRSNQGVATAHAARNV